jgi:hypothetical protein
MDPISTLPERLEQMVSSATKADHTGAVKMISELAGALADKTAITCSQARHGRRAR